MKNDQKTRYDAPRGGGAIAVLIVCVIAIVIFIGCLIAGNI